MTLLVTGGAGFIGSHFIDRTLRETDWRIVCLDNFNADYDPAAKRANVQGFARSTRVKIVEQSFTDCAAMRQLFRAERVRRVLHLGGHAGVRASILRPLDFEATNVRGSLILLEMAREFATEKFVFVSSSTVYGRGAQTPFREDRPLGTTLSPYGATKRAAEELCMTYALLHQLPVVVVRPFSVYGSRVRPDLAMHAFAHCLTSGRPLTLFGDGFIRRDFTHVHDVCAGLMAALRVPEAVGQIFNLGHNEPATIGQLISLLEQVFDRHAVIDYQPPAAGDMPLTQADLTRSRAVLGYVPRVTLADGVREFAAWFSARAGVEVA